MSTNRLGRFHIIREIARSNDIVYEAVDPQQGQRVAVKELLMPGNLAGPGRQDRVERFTREARAAARLKHPGIVRILEHGQDGNRYYIAMEFLQGESLRDRLRRQRSLPLQEALRIAADAADALQFAHSKEVVHRDIKPDNIHVEPDGRIVLTDFGIARITFEPTLTAAGQIFGTPSYMSPEQIAGRAIDHRTDIFSLGVMLYEMVAGRNPFTGDSVITITYNITHTEAPPVGSGPPGLEQVLQCAMAKDPAQRYRTAAELAEDLRLLSAGQTPRHARQPSAVAARSDPTPQRRLPSTPAPPARAPLPQPDARYGGNAAPPYRPLPAPPAAARPQPASQFPLPMGAYVPPGMSGAGAGAAGVQPVQMSILQQRQAESRMRAQQAAAVALWMVIGVILVGIIGGVVWATSIAMENVRTTQSAGQASSQLAEAKEAFDKGEFERALRIYTPLAGGPPSAFRRAARQSGAATAVELAEAKLDQGNPAEARRLASQAIQWQPDSAHALLVRARATAAEGGIDASLPMFDQALDAAGRAIDARGGKAQTARRLAREIPIWKAQVLYEAGVSLMRDRPLHAQARFSQAIEAAPGSDFARAAEQQMRLIRSGEPGQNQSGYGQPQLPDPDWNSDYRYAPGPSPVGP